MRFILVIIFLFSSCMKEENLKIAVIDTEFCVDLIKTDHQVHPPIYTTAMPSIGIAPECLNKKFSRNIHGHFILKNLLQKIPKKFEIYPIVVFSRSGIQTKESWIKAFNYIQSQNIGHVISASGYFNANNDFSDLPAKINARLHLSAGQYGNGVKKGMKLWPHETHNKKIFYGHKLVNKNESYPSKNLLYTPNIWIDENKKSSLKGSSYALSVGIKL